MGEEPRVTAVVSDGNRNEEIESSINKDGEYYLMELSGFKWNSGEQNIWIQNGDSILNTVVNAQDKGKTVEVGVDEEYTLNSVVLNASGKTMVTTFYYKVIQGREVYVGRSYSTVRLPKGNYNILSDFKVGEGDQKDRYILFRDDCEISQKESSVEFNTEDLVKVTARYINNTREEMKAGDMTLLKRGFGVNVSFDQALKGIYVCKGSYGSIKYTAQFGDFEYVYRKKNLDIYKDSDLYLDSDIRIDHNFRDFVFTKGSRLTGWVDFELGRYIRLFKLVDGSGNYISSIKNTESGSDEYHFNIKIENDEVSNTYYEDCDSYERITLPEIKGVYDLTAEVREGALPIAPLKVKIRICDEQVHEFYDFNGSGKPDKGDLRVLEENLNKKAADGIFDKMDINLDGIIDIYDIIRMTKRFNIGF